MTSQEILAEVNTAIRQFGEYTFGDKGPDEVMDTPRIVRELMAMPAQDVQRILLEVAKDKNGETLVSSLLVDLQDVQDDWWDTLMANDTLQDLY